VLLIAYMCPYSLEINISSIFFLHFWQGDSKKSQDLAWAACSVPRKWPQNHAHTYLFLNSLKPGEMKRPLYVFLTGEIIQKSQCAFR